MSLHGFLQGRGLSAGVLNNSAAAAAVAAADAVAAAAVAATTACGLGALLLLLLLPCSVPRCLPVGNYWHSFGDDPPS